MRQKVLLILADGMRADCVASCRHPFVHTLMQGSQSTMRARTVMPSVTLPAHMSLFHSVEPGRHGVLTNTYVPQARPVNGLIDCLALAKKTTALFYTWENLRDISQPGALNHSFFYSARYNVWRKATQIVVDHAIGYLPIETPDFAFLYLAAPDEIGHRVGWMTDEYIDVVYETWNDIERVFRRLPDGYTTIVMSDHGGHDQMHGTDLAEDMTIPLILHGPAFAPGSELASASILDIAPTIAEILGIEGDEAWEGKSLLR